MKFNLVFIILIAVLCSCSEKRPDYPAYHVKQLPRLIQEQIKQEAIAEIESETIETMIRTHEFYTSDVIPPCCGFEPRNTFEVQENKNGEVIISFRKSKVELDSVPVVILEFYTANSELNEQETEKYIQTPSYQYFNYPFYSSSSKPYLESKIQELNEMMILAQKNGNSDLTKFYRLSLDDVERKLKTLNTIGGNELKEIHPQTHIRIKGQSNKSGFSKASIKAFEGVLKVRNHFSQKYFDCSYLDLYYRDHWLKDEIAGEQAFAIRELCKASILDYSYAASRDWETGIEAPAQIELPK